jgi:hypothetical protein
VVALYLRQSIFNAAGLERRPNGKKTDGGGDGESSAEVYAAQTETLLLTSSPSFNTGFVVHHHAHAHPAEDMTLVFKLFDGM